MTTNTLIKTCGIKDPQLAFAAAKAGADFIGLVFAEHSKRLVSLLQAAAIAQATCQAGAIPVAVFTNHTAKQMLAICQQAKISWVQLHGDMARQQHALLPENFHCIYACTPADNGELSDDDKAHIARLKLGRDYLLFDNAIAGSGKIFDWSSFSCQGELPWFLSGGLSIKNVGQGIEQLHPTGVDVSTGIENEAGEKDLSYIQQFIDQVRGKLKL